jgi:hypothetical protein
MASFKTLTFLLTLAATLPLRPIIKSFPFMARSLGASPLLIRRQLPAGGSTCIPHRDIDIFVSMVHLRVVRDLNIEAGKVKSNRDVIEIALMVVTVSSLDNHLAVHDLIRETRELMQQRLSPLAHSLGGFHGVKDNGELSDVGHITCS